MGGGPLANFQKSIKFETFFDIEQSGTLRLSAKLGGSIVSSFFGLNLEFRHTSLQQLRNENRLQNPIIPEGFETLTALGGGVGAAGLNCSKQDGRR